MRTYTYLYIFIRCFRKIDIILNNAKKYTDYGLGYYFEQNEFWMEQLTGWLQCGTQRLRGRLQLVTSQHGPEKNLHL